MAKIKSISKPSVGVKHSAGPAGLPDSISIQKADDLDLEAACHLNCAKAVADLVATIANHPGALEELGPKTLFVAMDSVTRSIEAAENRYAEIWKLMPLNRASVEVVGRG